MLTRNPAAEMESFESRWLESRKEKLTEVNYHFNPLTSGLENPRNERRTIKNEKSNGETILLSIFKVGD